MPKLINHSSSTPARGDRAPFFSTFTHLSFGVPADDVLTLGGVSPLGAFSLMHYAQGVRSMGGQQHGCHPSRTRGISRIFWILKSRFPQIFFYLQKFPQKINVDSWIFGSNEYNVVNYNTQHATDGLSISPSLAFPSITCLLCLLSADTCTECTEQE